MNNWPPQIEIPPWLGATKTPSAIWLEVLDKLYWSTAFSDMYYPEKYGPGEWYERFVTDEQKEVLKQLTGDNMALPFPLWKFFGGCLWETTRIGERNGQRVRYGRPACGSCIYHLKGGSECIKNLDPSKASLCPFDQSFDPNAPRRSGMLKVP